jgi:hypothetical protein
VVRLTHTRLNVNLNEETACALKAISRKRGVTVTETIRRAVAVLKFFEDETRAGRHVEVVRGDAVYELVFL